MASGGHVGTVISDIARKDNEKAKFHVAEFVGLRKEILEHVKAAGSNFRTAIIANGGVIAWLATEGHKAGSEMGTVLRLAWILPFAISCLFGLLSCAAILRIGEIAAYLTRLEKQLAWVEFGWQHRFMSRKRKFNPMDFSYVYGAGWILLILGDIAIAWYAFTTLGVTTGANPSVP